jgi:hypothetical protein
VSELIAEIDWLGLEFDYAPVSALNDSDAGDSPIATYRMWA